MHADDILLLATSRQHAIQKMKCLTKYCEDNYIRLQMTKCAAMCINGCDEDRESINVANITLDTTSCEVYLGSCITNSNKLADDVYADIKHRQVNIVKFFAFLRSHINAPVDVKLKVLDACIMSSVLYNSETWANVNVDRLEIIHRRMLRSILGIGTTSCNEVLYIELGVSSIRTRIMIKQFEFWKKVLEMTDENPLKYAISIAKRYKLKEIAHYEKLHEKFSSKEEITTKFLDEMKSVIHHKAMKGRSKYLTYLQINPELETPGCYENAKHKFVSMRAKLRTSTHCLHIEMGRRTGTSRERRTCHCEDNSVEDENHFLFECASYHDIRTKYNIRRTTLHEFLNDGTHHNFIMEIMERRAHYNTRE